MKRIFIVISIAFLSFFISFTVVAQDTESVFDSWRLSKMPEFHEPGYKSFSEWVQTHVVYPETARKNKMEGVHIFLWVMIGIIILIAGYLALIYITIM